MLTWFEWFIKSGHIADVALLCLALELAYFYLNKSGAERKAIIFNTAAGVAMLLALRSALTGAPYFFHPNFSQHQFCDAPH
ncbi:MAG: hypothetical protein U5K75_08670 [Ahrensia sp.]|nr:hypothetical protein [Ahrensia sp.]